MRVPRFISAPIEGSLKLKLILVMVVIVGGTLGVAPWSAIKIQERQLLQVSADRLRALHEMLAGAIVAACVVSGSRESVQHVLDAVGRHRDLAGARLFTTDGVIGYSTQPAERGQRLSTTELSRYYGRADPIMTRTGRATLHTLVKPMFNEHACQDCHASAGKILGVLQVSVSLDRTWEQLAHLKRSALVATSLTLMVIVIAIWLSLTRLVDEPLQELVAVMGRAESGDLRARAPVRSHDEIGRLAGHFNEMISKLQTTQDELERYHQQQLAHADRLATLGEMAAAMAHEIRNPLTGISGAVSVLSRSFPSDDPRRETVRQTHLLIERLNKSVEDLLHYARPSRPQLQTVALDAVVTQSASLVYGEAKKGRIELVRQAAPEQSNIDAPAVIADPQQIQQVLVNLLLNAIQATPAGGRIFIRACGCDRRPAPSYACVEIEDTGKGLTEEEAAKAFQPFFSTKPQGTGLGLAIAKQIVESHQGRIALHSTPGEGTCVRVELPAALEPPAPGA
jgi:hypothetical protein